MPRFAQITDLHLRPPGVLTQGTIDADRFVAAAVSAIISRHDDLDAVIVTGDLSDLGEDDAYARGAMLLSRFSVPVLVMPGNHDRTGALREAFSAFPGVGDEPVAGKVCYARSIGGVTVVVLDTSLDDIANMRHEGEVGAAQLDWLDATLKAAAEPVLIGMHHPPFRTGIGFMDAITLTDTAAFSRVIARHDHVQRIVCGHVHRVILGEVAGVPALAVPGVAHQVKLALSPDAPPQLVMEPPAYAIHLVERGTTVSHMGYVHSFGDPAAFDDTAANRA